MILNVVNITYFVHSTSVYNEKKIMAGWVDVELSELGKKQSLELRELTKHMKFDAIFCSDLKRAYETAKTAFGERFKIIVDKRLRECNYGDMGGTSSELVDSLGSFDFINKPFPNGESYKDVEKRIRSFLKDLLQNYAGKHIAIVAHQAPQLSLEVITKGKTWEQAIKEDWRMKKAWQPGWEYILEG
jgi:broad specificity phosphatase PhoE